MMTIFFQEGPVNGWKTACKSDLSRYSKFFWGLIDRGHYMPCSQYEALFFSVTHTEADIHSTLAAVRETLLEMTA